MSQEEMTELLQNQIGQDVEGGAGSADENSGDKDSTGPAWSSLILQYAIDVPASILFWYVQFQPITMTQLYIFLGCLGAAMLMWRLFLAYGSQRQTVEDIPYTCAHVRSNGRDLFLVATVHISPRAPQDVEAVIHSTKPDIAMIELDEERLDRMRPLEPQESSSEPPQPKPEDLQMLEVTVPSAGAEPERKMTIYAQRAIWNAELAGTNISGEMVFNDEDPYGMGEGGHLDLNRSYGQSVVLARRGGFDGQWAPFALKAHKAEGKGAKAVLVVNTDERLPLNRIGTGTLGGDVKIALATCSCSLPKVPVLLLPKPEGEQLLELCQGAARGVRAEFKVREDQYPRRSLAKRLCQSFALIFSGIGVLYGIIQCFAVEVGGEFLAAEDAARAVGIPCVCIDVDLNRFWSRLGMALLPSPCNLLNSALSWLAFPRVCFRFLFPPRDGVDVFGGMILHGFSFPFKTWVAFILAGMCASFITSHLLELLGSGAELGAEQVGAVKKENREDATMWIMLGIEMYMLPQIYDAVAASRDEAMYQSMVKKARQFASRRLVVVVGAGHSNGILQRVRSSGL